MAVTVKETVTLDDIAIQNGGIYHFQNRNGHHIIKVASVDVAGGGMYGRVLDYDGDFLEGNHYYFDEIESIERF